MVEVAWLCKSLDPMIVCRDQNEMLRGYKLLMFYDWQGLLRLIPPRHCFCSSHHSFLCKATLRVSPFSYLCLNFPTHANAPCRSLNPSCLASHPACPSVAQNHSYRSRTAPTMNRAPFCTSPRRRPVYPLTRAPSCTAKSITNPVPELGPSSPLARRSPMPQQSNSLGSVARNL